MLVNWLIIAVAAHFFTALPWSLAFLFGALVTVTGPTVFAPLRRTVRPETEVVNILCWERHLDRLHRHPAGAISLAEA
ncbi:MAG: hypothetical protein IPK63_04460 [Candidatus Competibacteraceae bacterium]|nr:hypothetical protein [Candidatus Competibacteraceae bacterium]